MSYGMAAPLQAAVYQHLLADVGVAALVGSAIFDVVPFCVGFRNCQSRL